MIKQKAIGLVMILFVVMLFLFTVEEIWGALVCGGVILLIMLPIWIDNARKL